MYSWGYVLTIYMRAAPNQEPKIYKVQVFLAAQLDKIFDFMYKYRKKTMIWFFK